MKASRELQRCCSRIAGSLGSGFSCLVELTPLSLLSRRYSHAERPLALRLTAVHDIVCMALHDVLCEDTFLALASFRFLPKVLQFVEHVN